jgi:hypothetical protein
VEFFEFAPAAEFVDRTGIVRPIYGCSLLGRDEFWQRLAQLANRLESVTAGSFQAAYALDPRTQQLTARLLQLNGIDPDWVTLAQAEQLLISPGHLAQLNQAEQPTEASVGKDTPPTLPELIAAISSFSSIKDALDLANTVPANLLGDIVTARAVQSLPPKEQAREKSRKMMRAHKPELIAALKAREGRTHGQ